MASDPIENQCLVCSSLISTQKLKVEKLDAVFFLQILLEIPPDNQLTNTIRSSIASLQLCDSCLCTVNQCKQIYTEISEKLEKFWEHQNKLLDHFSSNQLAPRNSETDSNSWVAQCRTFVQNHDFTGFGYPFVIHDLETLLNSKLPLDIPPTLPPGVTCTLASGPSSSSQTLNNSDTLESSKVDNKILPSVTCTLTNEDNSTSTLTLNDTIASQIESCSLKDCETLFPNPENVTISVVKNKNNDNCEETKTESEDNTLSEYSSDEDEQPKMIRIIIAPGKNSDQQTHGDISNDNSQQEFKFEQDPITGKFICLDPSCSKSYSSKQYITKHYKIFHLKTREKDSFACDWPGCGKIISDKQTFNVHMDKHKGTPRTKCKICGDKFYWRKELLRHRRDKHGEEQEIFKCERAECNGKRFKDGIRLQAHMDQHNGTPREICGTCGQRFYFGFHLDEHQQQLGHF